MTTTTRGKSSDEGGAGSMAPLNVKEKRHGLTGYFLLYHHKSSFTYLFNKSGGKGGGVRYPLV